MFLSNNVSLFRLNMPDYLGDDQRKTKEEEKDDAPIRGKSKTLNAA